MPGKWPSADFPNLDPANYTVTSCPDRRYNCIAWAAGENIRKWWPDRRNIGYWPPGVPRVETMEAFFQAYGTLGYRICFTDTLEAGLEKVAIYGIRNPDGTITPTHASIQLPTGDWSSKLGDFEDISHTTPSAVTGPLYGYVIYYLSRHKRV